jgi:hypothetical protein
MVAHVPAGNPLLPYGQGVPVYVERGWDGIIPIHPSTKHCALKNVTGNDGEQMTAENSARVSARLPYSKFNIGLRMRKGMVGIDVDEYDTKTGYTDTIVPLEAELGPLPKGPYSTARGAGVSGIRFFRLPGDYVKFTDVAGKDVEIIQWHHRYAMVWPSIHPKTRGTYRWHAPDGSELPEPPRPEDFPVLPDAWVEYLKSQERVSRPYAPLVDKETGEILEGFQGTPPGLQRYVDKRCQEIRDEPVGGRGEPWVDGIALELSHYAPHQLQEDELRAALYAAVDTWQDHPEAGRAGVDHGLRHIGTPEHETRFWEERRTQVTGQDGERPTLHLGNAAESAEWLRDNLGTGPLAGMFRRSGEIVHTPRQGEDGYREPQAEGDEDGPAQVRIVDASRIASTVQWTYTCVRTLATGEQRAAMFPKIAAQVAVDCPEMVPNLRVLKGVTHTPLVRRDGSVLSTPGYDAATRMLYLPEVGLDMPEVPEVPTEEQVKEAVGLLMHMVDGFPFVHEDHRANYFGFLLTPLLRELLPPPYKAFGFNARQPGSGKTLMSTLGRIIHGGVFRGSTPEDEAEIRKQVTSILDQTTGPVVVFDNVTGVLKSATLAALLTSASYSDRRLGVTEEVTRANDRVWSFTGNNCQIGGDLPRRTILVDIDPGMPHPEDRTGFAINDIEGWVRTHRGELLRALLILVRAWVMRGMQYTQVGSDSYARWIGAVRAILANAGITGVFDSRGTRVEVADEDDEWADFLEAVEGVYGTNEWTIKDLLAEFSGTNPALTIDCLPATLADKANKAYGDVRVINKSLGRWLRNREGRWARDVTVRAARVVHRTQVWRIERHARGEGGFEGLGALESTLTREKVADLGGENSTGWWYANPSNPQTPTPRGGDTTPAA